MTLYFFEQRSPTRKTNAFFLKCEVWGVTIMSCSDATWLPKRVRSRCQLADGCYSKERATVVQDTADSDLVAVVVCKPWGTTVVRAVNVKHVRHVDDHPVDPHRSLAAGKLESSCGVVHFGSALNRRRVDTEIYLHQKKPNETSSPVMAT